MNEWLNVLKLGLLYGLIPDGKQNNIQCLHMYVYVHINKMNDSQLFQLPLIVHMIILISHWKVLVKGCADKTEENLKMSE